MIISFGSSLLLGGSPGAWHQVRVLSPVQVLHAEHFEGIAGAVSGAGLREGSGLLLHQLLLEASDLLLLGQRLAAIQRGAVYIEYNRLNMETGKWCRLLTSLDKEAPVFVPLVSRLQLIVDIDAPVVVLCHGVHHLGFATHYLGLATTHFRNFFFNLL